MMRTYIIIVIGIILIGAIHAIGGGAIVFAFGACILYFIGWPDYQKAKASVKWPKVRGTILSSKVVWKARRRGMIYTADISYSYFVDGKQLQSSRIYVGGKWGSPYKVCLSMC